MKLLSLQLSPPATFSPAYSRKLPSLGRRSSFFSPRATSSHTKHLFFRSDIEKRPDARDPRFFDIGQRYAVNVRVAAGSNILATEGISEETCSGDDFVFVAGATGRVGSRTVRELLKLGFRVRAGVRSKERAESLVQSVQQIKLGDDPNSSVQLVERLELVECNLENRGDIRTAIGSASIVICCIGASEKEVLDISGPLRIDYIAAKNLIDAATSLKVDHFILLTSLGTSKIGFPAAILNLFWGVLFWKRKAEEALLASGLCYTIVRPGGMERPTDAYKETHNLVLANEDTYFGGQVSNLQVAELIAFMAKNRSLSFCKVVEVIAETTAPQTQTKDLLLKIPSQRVDTSPPKEPQPMPKPDPASSQPASITVEKTAKIQETRPLSPYTAYADLKPPTSPTPTQSTASSGTPGTDVPESNSVHAQSFSVTIDSTLEKQSVSKTQPLSPYTAYDDLKPPTSPIPTTGTTSSPRISEQVPEKKQSIENLSPCTAIPTTKPSSDFSASNFQITSAATLKPLSPYTMYDDLKPPASPSPTFPRY